LQRPVSNIVVAAPGIQWELYFRGADRIGDDWSASRYRYGTLMPLPVNW